MAAAHNGCTFLETQANDLSLQPSLPFLYHALVGLHGGTMLHSEVANLLRHAIRDDPPHLLAASLLFFRSLILWQVIHQPPFPHETPVISMCDAVNGVMLIMQCVRSISTIIPTHIRKYPSRCRSLAQQQQ